MKNSILSAMCSALLLATYPISTAADPLVGAAAGEIAKSVFGELSSKLKDVIARAEAAGDHLIKQLALSALEVVEGWEKSSANLMDQAFSGIDANIRLAFNNIDELADRMLEGQEILMADAEKLTAEFSAIVKNLPMTSDKAEVYSYGPKVVTPTGTDIVRFSIVGPLLGASSPKALINGEEADVERPNDNEVVVVVDRKILNFGPDNSIFAQIRLDFDDERPGWWDRLTGAERNRLKREMSVWLLPLEAARYSISETVTRTRRETSVQSNTVAAKGKDAPFYVDVVVDPHLFDAGWRLDQDLLVDWAGGSNPNWHTQGKGDKADCVGLHRGSTSARGFTYHVQMGHRTVWAQKKDSWRHCHVSYPIYREVSERQVLPDRGGEIDWTNDVVLDLDDEIEDWKLVVTMYDGRSFTMTPHVPSPRRELRIEAAPRQIHMRPVMPKGF